MKKLTLASALLTTMLATSAFASNLNVICSAIDANLRGTFDLTVTDHKWGSVRNMKAHMINFKEGGIQMSTNDIAPPDVTANVHILLLENKGAGESSNCRVQALAYLEDAQVIDGDMVDSFVLFDKIRDIKLSFVRNEKNN